MICERALFPLDRLKTEEHFNDLISKFPHPQNIPLHFILYPCEEGSKCFSNVNVFFL